MFVVEKTVESIKSSSNNSKSKIDHTKQINEGAEETKEDLKKDMQEQSNSITPSDRVSGGSIPGTGYQIPGFSTRYRYWDLTRYWIPGTRYQVFLPGTDTET